MPCGLSNTDHWIWANISHVALWETLLARIQYIEVTITSLTWYHQSTRHLRGWKLGNFIKVMFSLTRAHCLTAKSLSISPKIPGAMGYKTSWSGFSWLYVKTSFQVFCQCYLTSNHKQNSEVNKCFRRASFFETVFLCRFIKSMAKNDVSKHQALTRTHTQKLG